MKTTSDFAVDVYKGLSAKEKYLSSKYFYDDNGSRIFRDIMRMPEYYLTDAELEIFQIHQKEIVNEFTTENASFDLIELGAGDGLKTRLLISGLLQYKADFTYIPVDISEAAVKNIVTEFTRDFPVLALRGITGDYFRVLDNLSRYPVRRKILLFLGSNIGNFTHGESVGFLKKIKQLMSPGDMLFIGFDLKKNPEIILKAYNDPHGHTAAFNLNLLSRINRELNADFDLSAFKHIEVYDEKTGTAVSRLVSLKEQKVFIKDIKLTAHFKKGESVFMEMSQKYNETMVRELATEAGFRIVRNFHDNRLYFMNSLWKLNN